jgi:hypothetical protein
MAKFRIVLNASNTHPYRVQEEIYDGWTCTWHWERITDKDFVTEEEAKIFIERYKQKGKVVWEGE